MVNGASVGSMILLTVEGAYPILMAAVLLRYRRVLDTSPWLKERIGNSYQTIPGGRFAPYARLHQPLMLLRRLVVCAIPFIA